MGLGVFRQNVEGGGCNLTKLSTEFFALLVCTANSYVQYFNIILPHQSVVLYFFITLLKTYIACRCDSIL